VRIIRGFLKTKKLTYPKRAELRPTTDFAKEGLFNILEHEFNNLEGGDLKLLDLCAGTGNISFEWISRNAGEVVAIDSNIYSIRHLIESSKKYEVADKIQIIRADVRTFLKKNTQTFDLIFVDPPYDITFHLELVNIVFDKKLLKENGIMIVEHGKFTDLSIHTNFYSIKKYGNVLFSFFTYTNNFPQ